MANAEIYCITEKEAREVKQVKRIFFNTGKISAASAVGAYAIGGLIHYFGGPAYASAANQIIQNSHLLAIGGTGSLFLSIMPYRIRD